MLVQRRCLRAQSLDNDVTQLSAADVARNVGGYTVKKATQRFIEYRERFRASIRHDEARSLFVPCFGQGMGNARIGRRRCIGPRQTCRNRLIHEFEGAVILVVPEADVGQSVEGQRPFVRRVRDGERRFECRKRLGVFAPILRQTAALKVLVE